MANQPLTRTEWMASLAEDIDKFDWSGEGNKRWVGLTDEEREQFRQWAHPDIIEAIELRLQERNT